MKKKLTAEEIQIRAEKKAAAAAARESAKLEKWSRNHMHVAGLEEHSPTVRGYLEQLMYDYCHIDTADARPSVSCGNRKIGSIPSFSLLPVVTCSPEARAACGRTDCYACKMCNANKDTRRAWQRNTFMATEHLPQLESWLTGYFWMNRPRFFRVHVGGDFVTREYAEMWARIARANPDTVFLAFTKYWSNVRSVAFPWNLKLRLSGWTGVQIPEDLRKLYPVADVIEPGQPEPAGHRICFGDCEHCLACFTSTEDVAFHKH